MYITENGLGVDLYVHLNVNFVTNGLIMVNSCTVDLDIRDCVFEK